MSPSPSRTTLLWPGHCSFDGICSASNSLSRLFPQRCVLALVVTTNIVVGVEHIEDLVDFSIKNVKKDGKVKYLEGPEPLVVLKVADGREGYPPYAPYDVIHVGAASPEKPIKLLKQLANGGRLVCPVGRGWQSLRVFDKDSNGRVSEFDAMGVTYVPLTSAKEQTDGSKGLFA